MKAANEEVDFSMSEVRFDNPRIFIGLTEIAGYYSQLAEGLAAVGYRTSYIRFTGDPYQYGGGGGMSILRWIRWLGGRLKSENHLLLPLKILFLPIYALLSLAVLTWALARFDVFVLGGHSRFLPGFLELPLLKLFRKRLIWVFHGSDSRPPYLSGHYQGGDVKKLYQATRRIRRIVRWVDKWADIVIEHHPTSHFHSRELVSWLSIGIPFSLSDGCGSNEARSVKPGAVQIVHAPSSPKQKGTEEIRNAVRRLAHEENVSIEYNEITGRPHHEVLAALRNCDFVVDEIYSDTAMAGFATEAAWFSRPAVVCGYEIGKVLSSIQAECRPPAYMAKPENLYDAIRAMLVDEETRLRIGKQAQDFVKQQWSRDAVVQRFASLVSGDVPGEWKYDPGNECYLYGWGMPEEVRNRMVANLVSAYGPTALGLDDKPAIRDALLDAAGITV